MRTGVSQEPHHKSPRMNSARIFILVIVVFATFAGCRTDTLLSNDFVQYAINFEVPQSDGYPPLPVLPNAIYQAALSLKKTDAKSFHFATALIFAKCFHRYGSYILFDDPDDIFGLYLEDGNTKYFLVRSLAEAVSGAPRTRENVLRENSPLYFEHETWYASSASAVLFFTKKLSPTNEVQRELGRAWIRYGDTLPDEEKYR